MVLKNRLSKQKRLLFKPTRRSGRGFPLVALALAGVLWLSGNRLASQTVSPQAVLLLGGSTPALERERFAANFARQHPNLQIWISGGSPQEYTEKVFAKAGVDKQRLHFDYRAQDTLTNFTTTVDQLKAKGIRSVYLITSDFHMNRAQVVGELILGSRGITFQKVAVPSKRSPEPIEKSIRDGARAIFWLATGFTGVGSSENGNSAQK